MSVSLSLIEVICTNTPTRIIIYRTNYVNPYAAKPRDNYLRDTLLTRVCVCVCQINNRKLNIIMQHVTNNNKNKNNRNRTFKLAVMFARSFCSVCVQVYVCPPGIFAQLCTKLITFEFPRTISRSVGEGGGKMLPIVFPLVDTLIQWNCTITTTTAAAIKPGIYPLFHHHITSTVGWRHHNNNRHQHHRHYRNSRGAL